MVASAKTSASEIINFCWKSEKTIWTVLYEEPKVTLEHRFWDVSRLMPAPTVFKLRGGCSHAHTDLYERMVHILFDCCEFSLISTEHFESRRIDKMTKTEFKMFKQRLLAIRLKMTPKFEDRVA